MKKIGLERQSILNIASKIIIGFQDLKLTLKEWEKGMPSIRKVNLFMRSSLIPVNLPKIGASHSENSSRSISRKEMTGTNMHKITGKRTKISNISDGIEREADRQTQPTLSESLLLLSSKSFIITTQKPNKIIIINISTSLTSPFTVQCADIYNT